ncbi:MAG: aminoacetone oxidase family FAD-binding enzyme [Eggerthellaceae bacterium]|nr:aminoacetone oxidase family FAD-binding enzyme [Eggerthellaceae bacterium]
MAKKRNKSAKRKLASEPVIVPSGTYDIAIVGGGASGLACAIACMQQVRQAQEISDTSVLPRIVILESGKRIGASIMRSGNGRCNFSNAHLDISRYHHADFVQEAFSALESNSALPSALEWFKQLGLVWKETPGSDGLLYPLSNKANSVLDVLRYALDRDDTSLRTSSVVHAVRKANAVYDDSVEASAPFALVGETTLTDEEKAPFEISANQVVIASGGATSYTLLPDFEVCYSEPMPLLGPLKVEPLTSEVSLATLDGIRMQACLRIPERSFEEEGEILFRDYGLSGIVVFNASRYAQPGDTIVLDLIPEYSADALSALFIRRLDIVGRRKPLDFLLGFVLPSLALALIQKAGIDQAAQIAEKDIPALVKACKEFSFQVCGIADVRTCQVRRGGIHPSASNASTMQLVNYPGLFVLGEALDVDGPCGGYNLHWAWTTGLLAGSALAANFLHSVHEQK